VSDVGERQPAGSVAVDAVKPGPKTEPRPGRAARCHEPFRGVGVDRSGVIVAHALTESTVDDATTAIELINAIDGGVASITGDAAYDTIAIYTMPPARVARSSWWPPAKTARVSRRDALLDRFATLDKRLASKVLYTYRF
jgi:hypothetical protein